MLEPLTGGANNRVYRVVELNRRAVLKWYFHDSRDQRDRFGAERAFYSWIQRQGIDRTAEVLAWDERIRVGLLSYIDGRRLISSELNEALIQQAVEFVAELNRARTDSEALTLPHASESCFSIEQHLACVDRRITRLRQIALETDVSRAAARFVSHELEPAWNHLRRAVAASSAHAGERARMAELPMTARCLSPSDFGFHNALLGPDGKLRFFDFEYAGWDDTAKLICDFFCQPKVPVPRRFWDLYVSGIEQSLGLDRSVRDRAECLLPVYQIKWCCIMLNEFVPADSARRGFASGDTLAEERKLEQLQRARAYLQAAIDEHGLAYDQSRTDHGAH